MRNTLLWAVGALAVLVLPALGHAATGPYIWNESSTALDHNRPSVERFDFTNASQHVVTIGCTSQNCVNDGFEFDFFGTTYTTMKVGTKGYVAFGENDRADASPTSLSSTSGPSQVIAAWWGDHTCDETAGVRHEVVGVAPNREHRVEWQCSADSAGDVSFRARVTLFENSSVIQLHYGSSAPQGSTDWTSVRVGLKSAGPTGVLFSNALADCNAGSCNRSHFPTGKVIQYGTWVHDETWQNPPDLLARIHAVEATMELVGDEPVARISVEGDLLNLSDIAIDDIGYRVYVADRPASFSVSDRVGIEVTGQNVDALGDLPFSHQDLELNSLGEPAPNGTFYVCVGAVALLKPEVNKENNWNCHPEPIVFGPDLTGSAEPVVAEGETLEVGTMEVFDVAVQIENIGNLVALADEDAPITYSLWAVNLEKNEEIRLLRADAMKWSDVPTYDNPPEDVGAHYFRGTVTESIHPGQTASQTVRVKMPFTSNNGTVEFQIQLRIDVAWPAGAPLHEDANTTNNWVLSADSFEYLVPAYSITPGSFDYTMPFQCVMEEPAWGSFEICNMDGTADAWGFVPAIRYPHGSAGTVDPETGHSASLLRECKSARLSPFPVGGRYEVIEEDDQTKCAEDELCSWQFCWQNCDPYSTLENHGCGEGFACMVNPFHMQAFQQEIYSCLPHIPMGECRTYEFDGLVPPHQQDPSHLIFTPEDDWYIRFDDMHPMMPTGVANPGGTPSSAESEMRWSEEEDDLICYHRKADLVAEAMPLVPVEVVAGEQFVVERLIRNVGTLPSEFEYAYHFSLIPEVSSLQPRAPVVASADGLGRANVGRKILTEERTTSDGINRRHDTLVMPSETPPGLYYFGLVIDPGHKVAEIDKSNNIYVYPRQIRVREASFRIETDRLPYGTVGVRYNFSLWASGGTGDYRWEKGDGFPAWLDLDPVTGHLSGIPTDARDYTFQVRARSGNLSTSRTFNLRVLAPEGTLWIPTHVLPVAIADNTYGPVELKANGGLPPYEWFIESIDDALPLPVGFCFDPAGLILTCLREDGTQNLVPPHLTAGSRPFIVGVRDARGAEARAELKLQLAGRLELVIETDLLPTAQVGIAYPPARITARGGSGTNYTWVVENLPKGLQARDDAGDVVIEGTPLEWGVFMIQATVFDPSGMNASKSIPLEVANNDLTLARNNLGAFERGAMVDERLDIRGLTINEEATIRLLQGRLPSGLELTADHRVTGVISSAAEPGIYSVLLELRSDSGRLSPAPLSIRVKAPPAPTPDDKKDGCGASATGSSPAGALPMALALLGLFGLTRKNGRREADETL